MNFEGQISSSKSLVNRYLILQQGFPNLKLNWNSKADDVLLLDKALKEYREKQELYVGEGGTTFRFLVLFLSTQKGKWVVTGEESLFKRPHQDLYDALDKLNVEYKVLKKSLQIESQGWKAQQSLTSSLSCTTQVVTGLILASLATQQELEIHLTDADKGSEYLELTLGFLKLLGIKVEASDKKIYICKQQTLGNFYFSHIESDWSSAAFIYILAALHGRARVFGFWDKKIQPDSAIMDILTHCGVGVSKNKVRRLEGPYTPMHISLKKTPDLFPVLAAFCCFCRGESTLYGAPQLVFKESNRLEMIYRLLTQCGYKVKRLEDGIKIEGRAFKVQPHDSFVFDVSKDHRIFMAAEVLKSMGYKIDIQGEESIKKSFPEYLEIKKGLGF